MVTSKRIEIFDVNLIRKNSLDRQYHAAKKILIFCVV